MSITNLPRYTIPLTLTLLVTACGGGNTGSGQVTTSTDSSDVTNQSAVELGAANPISATNTISGRVADGYIQGARVCVDINENDLCESDEPFSVSTEGGIYELAVPALHSDKPIVAAIPAEAIDEDTGEAVGKAMVFIAPADQPTFLSPITTLVHQERRSNPALTSVEAEQAVKNMLGITDADVGLFTDYVAQSDVAENTSGNAERFKYLHDTARVVASMMKDIESQVEIAAVSRGVDVAGDEDTRRAIQNIVRNEVRNLLPQIAREVSIVVNNARLAAESAEGTALTEFDPQALAVLLRPDVEAENVTGRIEANLNRVDVVDSDLRSLLVDGVYWMEIDCHYETNDENLSVVSEQSVDLDIDQSNISTIRSTECEALYGKAQLTDDGSELVSHQYVLDVNSGSWESTANDDEFGYANYSLVNGEWKVASSEGPDGQIEFLTENSAIVTNNAGTMQLKAVTQSLGGTPVFHHLLEDGSDPMWFELVGEESLFPSESQAHLISVRQTYHPYVMYNFPAYHNDEQNRCADYGGNCNVVDIISDGAANVGLSLDQLRESMVAGVNLRTHGYFDRSALMRLSAAGQSDGQLPTQGNVEWVLDGENQAIEYPTIVNSEGVDAWMPAAAEPASETEALATSEECVLFSAEESEQTGVDVSNDIPLDLFAPGEFAGTRDELAALIGERPVLGEEGSIALPISGDFAEQLANAISEENRDEACVQVLSDNAAVALSQNDDSTVTETVSTEATVVDFSAMLGPMLTGQWELIEVDGVNMIEIRMPAMFGDRADNEYDEAMLLIEHEGYVRSGARLPDTRIDRVFTYNENAFVTLRSLVESGMGATP